MCYTQEMTGGITLAGTLMSSPGYRDFPGGLEVKTLRFQCRVQVQYLVGELIYMPRTSGPTKVKINKIIVSESQLRAGYKLVFSNRLKRTFK